MNPDCRWPFLGAFMNIWPSYSQPEILGLWCSRDMVVFKGSPGEPNVKHGESINLVTFKKHHSL